MAILFRMTAIPNAHQARVPKHWAEWAGGLSKKPIPRLLELGNEKHPDVADDMPQMLSGFAEFKTVRCRMFRLPCQVTMTRIILLPVTGWSRAVLQKILYRPLLAS